MQEDFLKKEEYIAHREFENFLKKHPNCNHEEVEKALLNHNKRFLERKAREEKEYFDHCFDAVDSSIHLDREQIEAILTDEDASLIIAGAGSGKTTTMTAKVKYLVEKKHILPSHILVISFTNKAVLELQERIYQRFSIPCEIKTFHKLGYSIIKEKEKRSLSLIESQEVYTIMEEYFQKEILNKQEKLFCVLKSFPTYFSHSNLFLSRYFSSLFPLHLDNRKFLEFLIQFIMKCKSFGKTPSECIPKNTKNKQDFLILEEFYQNYEKELKLRGKIDFSDMIYKAISYIPTMNKKYEYIIIDEYQDISYDRFLLIQALREKNAAKVIAVGDDWQSIYAFSGSRIELFTDFQKQMGYAKILKICHTYRNSQELIDLAGKFIMKNPRQISKKLLSSKREKFPVHIYYYKTVQEKIESLLVILEEITLKSPQARVLLLGRYTMDISFLSSSPFFLVNKEEVTCFLYPTLKLTFLTVHKAKGLGFDEVILLNATNATYGFPSKIKDEKWNQLFLLPSLFPYEEERRLFYVALTRTKHSFYLLSPKQNPSIFIQEIKHNPSVYIHYFWKFRFLKSIKKHIVK